MKTWKYLILNAVVITALLCGGLTQTTSASAHTPASVTSSSLASALDNCWATAYAPWISGTTIHFSASTFCYPNQIDMHRISVEAYRNGTLQKYVTVECHDTSYCHAETTVNDSSGNQTWCTVIEGTFYEAGLGGRVFPGQKACESESW